MKVINKLCQIFHCYVKHNNQYVRLFKGVVNKLKRHLTRHCIRNIQRPRLLKLYLLNLKIKHALPLHTTSLRCISSTPKVFYMCLKKYEQDHILLILTLAQSA